MPIIVNADDFGMSASVNQGILESFRQGWISSATLMANMPGFGEAVAMAESHGLRRCLGVHLNLTDGMPLTETIRGESRLCGNDGRFRARARDLFRLNAAETRAVAEELKAQVAACRSVGIEPTHLDSHHHVHTSWAVAGVVMRLARDLGVPFVRTAHNAGALISRKHKLYSALLNMRLRRHGLCGTAWFCSVPSATQALLDAPGGIEVMTHPVMSEDGQVREFARGPVLGPLMTELLRGRRLVSYGMLERP